jgi:hypothetical protein
VTRLGGKPQGQRATRPGVRESEHLEVGVRDRVHLLASRPGKAPSGEAGTELTGVRRGSAERWWRVLRIRRPSARTVGTAGPGGPFHLIHGRGLHLAVHCARVLSPRSRSTRRHLSVRRASQGPVERSQPSDRSVGRRAWPVSRMTAQASATGPTCPSSSGLIPNGSSGAGRWPGQPGPPRGTASVPEDRLVVGTCRLRLRSSYVALQAYRVVRLLQPGDQFMVEVGVGPDADVVTPPPGPVIGGLDDAGVVEPAV